MLCFWVFYCLFFFYLEFLNNAPLRMEDNEMLLKKLVDFTDFLQVSAFIHFVSFVYDLQNQ